MNSCRKNGLPWVTACSECWGVGCYNASEEDRHDVEEVDDRNLFETFIDTVSTFQTLFTDNDTDNWYNYRYKIT